MDAKPVPVTVILVCPCCASTVDTDETQEQFTCTVCGQTWAMALNVDRLRAHSLY